MLSKLVRTGARQSLRYNLRHQVTRSLVQSSNPSTAVIDDTEAEVEPEEIEESIHNIAQPTAQPATNEKDALAVEALKAMGVLPDVEAAQKSVQSVVENIVEEAEVVKSSDPLEGVGLSPELQQSLKRSGITRLFPVQLETLAHSISGKDMLVRSGTGTGKTLAFSLPILQHSLSNPNRGRKPFALVLAPTRELAIQTASELNKHDSHIRSVCVYGGTEYRRQVRALDQGVDVVVGTPGRMFDLLQGGNLDLSEVKIAVLDEADQMLDVGFQDELDGIYELMPARDQMQNLFFSATFSREVKAIANDLMNDHVVVDLVGSNAPKIPEGIAIQSMEVERHNQIRAIETILKANKGKQSLIFVETKRDCTELGSHELGVRMLPLNGDMQQATREATLQKFRSGKLDCIVATDVAARGLDIPTVDLVIHCGPPKDLEHFVHRTGRTGRAGRDGKCILLHTRRDEGRKRSLEKALKIKFGVYRPPSGFDLLTTFQEEMLGGVVSVRTGEARKFRDLAEKLKEMESNGELQVDPIEAVLSIAGAGLFKASQSYSGLDGQPGLQTLEITFDDPPPSTEPLYSIRDAINNRLRSVQNHGKAPCMKLGRSSDGRYFMDVPADKGHYICEAEKAGFQSSLMSNGDVPEELETHPRNSGVPRDNNRGGRGGNYRGSRGSGGYSRNRGGGGYRGNRGGDYNRGGGGYYRREGGYSRDGYDRDDRRGGNWNRRENNGSNNRW